MDFGSDSDDYFWCDSRPNFSNAPDVGEIYGILGDGEETKRLGFEFILHVDTCQPLQRVAALILGRNFAFGKNHAFDLRSCLSVK